MTARSTAPRRPSPIKAKQKGNAVLFSLLGLVIGGIVLAVGIDQYQDAERSSSVQQTIAQVNTIIGSAKQNYGQYGYAGLTTPMSVGSGVIPAALKKTATTAENKFGGAVTLAAGTVANTAILTYAGVPSNMCTVLVNGTQSLARQIVIGTTTVKPLDGVVDLAALNTQCTAGATASIGWVIGRS